MTYSLDTLNSRNALPASGTNGVTGIGRFAHELGLVIGFVVLVFWLAALLSHSLADVAWTTTGARGADAPGAVARNWGGRFGARLADGSYFLFGLSVWWALAAGFWAWLAALARWLRSESLPAAAPLNPQRLKFWVGITLLLLASCALEWSRLYRFEQALPGHAGGLLGYLAGPASVKWLGFTGSGLVWIAIGVVSVSVVFGFSWPQAAQRIGAWIDDFIDSRREKRELAEDLAVGRASAREREEILIEERIDIEEHQPVAMPKSARSRCFLTCWTPSCRRWTCSTAPCCARKPSRLKRWR